ncbi:hypothetical protein SAMN05216327_103134 [Dyadobacter sp. SG02]|nr:hypothetical protein SAMN05216327_103134 [Dyadobacter sp. SG02]
MYFKINQEEEPLSDPNLTGLKTQMVPKNFRTIYNKLIINYLQETIPNYT